MQVKKSIVLCSMIVSLLVSGVFAAGAVDVPKNTFKKPKEASYTGARFCLWPNIAWPPAKTIKYVEGMNIGLVSFGKDGYVIGADTGLVSLSNYVRGAQVALYGQGLVMEGAQVCLVNINKNVIGAQVGIYNGTDVMEQGAQVGIVNNAKKSDAIQIGLINIMENGFLPVFPFFNYPKSWHSK
ncbi:MAG TPA: hypothetical protein QF753_07415 [Victivallales bacterium]|nr:hypothetical protein [Victivallales bacterium]